MPRECDRCREPSQFLVDKFQRGVLDDPFVFRGDLISLLVPQVRDIRLPDMTILDFPSLVPDIRVRLLVEDLVDLFDDNFEIVLVADDIDFVPSGAILDECLPDQLLRVVLSDRRHELLSPFLRHDSPLGWNQIAWQLRLADVRRCPC